jgi:hypothetical protein
VRSWRSKRLKRLFAQLPSDAQRQADEAYQIFRRNPSHPSLHFNPIDPSDSSVYSVRSGLPNRAIGSFLPNGDFLWLWIGSHAEYDKVT